MLAQDLVGTGAQNSGSWSAVPRALDGGAIDKEVRRSCRLPTVPAFRFALSGTHDNNGRGVRISAGCSDTAPRRTPIFDFTERVTAI